MRLGTADFCHALGATFSSWNDLRDDTRLLIVVGASRRTGKLAPDRRTAFLRFNMQTYWDNDVVRAEFAALAPEPDFPETSAGGLGPIVTRLLRRRLGATAQVSNLGLVEGEGLVSVAMFPSLNGPRAVSFGLATTPSTTTMTIRTRSEDFTAEDSGLILEQLAARFAGPRANPQ
jgi:hypothetical protein